MTDITISAAAIEAGAKAAYEVMVFGSSGVGWTPWDEAPEHLREHYRAEARAACLAMIEAWPGMERHTFPESGSGDDYTPPIDEIFLPLPPQENPND